MPAHIRSDGLDQITPDDLKGEDIAIGWEDPPPPVKRGRGAQPSKWVRFIALAESAAAVHRGTKSEEIGGRQFKVGPWLHYPKDREPVVGAQVRTELAAKFGIGSDYHRDNDDDAYFEVLLRDTIAVRSSTGKSTNTKGVLYVRKVIPAKAAK